MWTTSWQLSSCTKLNGKTSVFLIFSTRTKITSRLLDSSCNLMFCHNVLFSKKRKRIKLKVPNSKIRKKEKSGKIHRMISEILHLLEKFS